jgi:hypothetical protein
LLFPLSDNESPKMKRQGTCGSPTTQYIALFENKKITTNHNLVSQSISKKKKNVKIQKSLF